MRKKNYKFPIGAVVVVKNFSDSLNGKKGTVLRYSEWSPTDLAYIVDVKVDKKGTRGQYAFHDYQLSYPNAGGSWAHESI